MFITLKQHIAYIQVTLIIIFIEDIISQTDLHTSPLTLIFLY